MANKILGYALIALGIGIILFVVVDGYRTLTKQKEYVQFFNFQGISLDMSAALSNSLPPEIGQLLQQAGPLKQEIIPAEMVNGPTNIFVYLLFLGFFAMCGARIASIGTTLTRSVVVNLKEDKVTQTTTQ
jgi:hypothetical protein